MGKDKGKEASPEVTAGISPVEDSLARARELLDGVAGKDGDEAQKIDKARTLLDVGLVASGRGRLFDLMQKFGPLIYMLTITGIEMIFVELYCRWHGARFITLDLYSEANIEILSKIDFVGAEETPSAMSFVAEVLMWSSLGVWAMRAFTMLKRYKGREIQPAHDIAEYAGTLIRNTTVAAIVMILLKLSQFSVFGQSLENFEATAGVAFLLGFFGDDAYSLLERLRESTIGKAVKSEDRGDAAAGDSGEGGRKG